MSFLKALGPISPSTAPRDALRAGLGAALALCVLGLFLLKPEINLHSGLYLIAPFGASAVLIFAVPNSPLAQPWSVVIGNSLAALIGVSISLLIPHIALASAVAVGITVTVLALLRALHPPAGAIALLTTLTPEVSHELGYLFVLSPVFISSLALALLGMSYHALTGRHYPFRQFNEPGPHKTADRNPVERLGLGEDELIALLEDYRQSFNIGVEDLSRLIGAAQMSAAAHASGNTVVQDVMSRELITTPPTASLREVAQLFERHTFTSLPVMNEAGGYLGLIYQHHVIAGLSHHLRDDAGTPLLAADVMADKVPVAGPLTPLGILLPMMAQGDIDAVPIVQAGKLVGIVTRTDLIAALARQLAHRAPPDTPRAAG